jgi:hypothetical protein
MAARDKLLVDCRVLCTSLYASERSAVERLAVEHGGVLVGSRVSINDPPHVVITRSVRSHKYRAVMRIESTIPVVGPAWLADSVAAGRQLPHAAYRVGPFQGLVVCLSGLNPAKKAALAAAVSAHGGQHSAHLDRKCSHLVAASTDTDKYR